MGYLIVTAIVMWVTQTALGLWQFKRFNRELKAMRREGRVAIGKAKGRFSAGAIVMFVIDNETRIWRGKVMEGRTVFADFKEFDGLDGKKLTELTAESCENFSDNVKKAVLNARKDYENYCGLTKEKNLSAVGAAA